MSETPNTQATPGSAPRLSPWQSRAPWSSRLRRRLKSSAPNPCASPPSSLKATESAPSTWCPTPARCWSKAPKRSPYPPRRVCSVCAPGDLRTAPSTSAPVPSTVTAPPYPPRTGERPRCASTPNAPPAISSVPSDAIAAPSWRTACASLAAPAGTSSTCATTKDVASAWSTSSAPTRCRMPGSTRSTRTWRSAWTATCATTRRRH